MSSDNLSVVIGGFTGVIIIMTVTGMWAGQSNNQSFSFGASLPEAQQCIWHPTDHCQDMNVESGRCRCETIEEGPYWDKKNVTTCEIFYCG